jgi:biopolymer transport protein ExbD
MRRKGLEPMHDEHVNVTPLIDVIMCLIIFFLCCSTLAKDESNDRVQIPRAALGQEMPEQRGRLLINLLPHARLGSTDGGSTPGAFNPTDEPDIIIRGRLVPLTDLTAYLRKEKQDAPDLKVILRADQDLTYQWISPVMISCVQANITSVNFSTRKE